MGIDYACQRFYSAVRSLTCEGTLKQRLRGAAMHLDVLKAEKDFPPGELRQRFSDLKRKLTEKEDRDDKWGNYGASVDAMSNEEREETAEEILSIFTDLAYHDPIYYYH